MKQNKTRQRKQSQASTNKSRNQTINQTNNKRTKAQTNCQFKTVTKATHNKIQQEELTSFIIMFFTSSCICDDHLKLKN
jgi:hypothetical protein